MRLRSLALIIGTALPQVSHADPVLGLWETQDRDGHVSIEECGGNRLCGRLAWYAPSPVTGPEDRQNRDRRLRARPLIGILILSDMPREPETDGAGWLYNPYDGKTFAARMTLRSANQLRVTGCFGPVCRSNIWRRLSH